MFKPGGKVLLKICVVSLLTIFAGCSHDPSVSKFNQVRSPRANPGAIAHGKKLKKCEVTAPGHVVETSYGTYCYVAYGCEDLCE